jgi:hypothetical protein
MYEQKTNPRVEYRLQENQRVKDSVSLAEKFGRLKSLTVDLAYYGPEAVSKTSEIKYTANLAHAKSLFRFDCPNEDCVGGDFDLSQQLAKAVAGQETTLAGEVICQGWQSKATIDRMHCHHILRFRLSLEY